MGLLHTGEVNAIRSRSTCMHAEPSSSPPPLHTPKFIHIHTIFINLYIFVSYHLSISIYPLMISDNLLFLLSLDINFPFLSYISFLLYPSVFFLQKKKGSGYHWVNHLYSFSLLSFFFLFFVFLSLRFLSSLLNVCHGFMFHVFMILDL